MIAIFSPYKTKTIFLQNAKYSSLNVISNDKNYREQEASNKEFTYIINNEDLRKEMIII